ncbi:MAG: DUF4215 domain-containing protein [Deltaproteobacteria bacterium]|nr:DUF4215 domain-containing protein [Deltaproteobacteria bacterium]MBI4223432.1 DUF4215 domain-containing protein [Deltaproteobacteria bacterium]
MPRKRLFAVFILLPLVFAAGSALGLGDRGQPAPKKPDKRVIQRIDEKPREKGFFEKFTIRLKALVFTVRRCGNDRVEEGEECDDGNRLNGDGCTCSCKWEPVPRDHCGNNVCETGEANVRVNGEVPLEGWPTICSGDCTGSVKAESPPHVYNVVCGNCLIDGTGEECDDGNTVSGDGCNSICRREPVCGNGVVDEELDEVCDDGNTNDLDGCRNDCQASRCGDGLVTVWESCDDGNLANGDGCNALCLNEPDGPPDIPECPTDLPFVDEEDCECDEDTPPASCNHNGIVETGEECDDGNDDDSDGCSSDCREACRLIACGCETRFWTREFETERAEPYGLVKTDDWGSTYAFTGGKILKLDACGFRRWERDNAATQSFVGETGVVDSSGYSYVAFQFSSSPGGVQDSFRVKKISPCGTFLWDRLQTGITPGYRIGVVGDLRLDEAGNLFALFIEETGELDFKWRIHKYSAATGSPAGPPWPLELPDETGSYLMDVGPDGNLALVFRDDADATLTIRKISPMGAAIAGFGTSLGETSFSLPAGGELRQLKTDAAGNIYLFAYWVIGRVAAIKKFNPFGIPLAEIPIGEYNMDERYAIDRDGFIYSAEHILNPLGDGVDLQAVVSKWTPAGELVWTNSDRFSSSIRTTSRGIGVGPDGSIHMGAYDYGSGGRSFIRKLTPDGVTGP